MKKALAVLAAIVLAVTGTACLPTEEADSLWRAPIADMPFTAAYSTGGAVGTDSLFAMGGFAPGLTEMPLARLDLQTLTWSPRAALVSTAGSRVIGSGTISGDVPYACVFEVDLASNSLRCARYDDDADLWIDLPRPPMVFEQDFGLGALDGILFLALSRRVLTFDPATSSTWSEGSGFAVSREVVLVPHEGLLYRFNGGNSSNRQIEAFDPVLGSWATLGDVPAGMILGRGGFSLDGRIWLIRGAPGTLVTYDPADGSFVDVAPLRTTREGVSLIGGGDTLFLTNGNDVGAPLGVYLPTVEGYVP